jgi:hypothetical protein
MTRSPRGAAVALATGALALLALWAVGATFADGFALDLGSVRAPAPRYAFFLASFCVLGGLAVAAIATGLALLLAAAAGERLPHEHGSDRAWLLGGAAAAFAIPALLRALLLEGTRVPTASWPSCWRAAGSGPTHPPTSSSSTALS